MGHPPSEACLSLLKVKNPHPKLAKSASLGWGTLLKWGTLSFLLTKKTTINHKGHEVARRESLFALGCGGDLGYAANYEVGWGFVVGDWKEFYRGGPAVGTQD